jgi:hypothetical protein
MEEATFYDVEKVIYSLIYREEWSCNNVEKSYLFMMLI